MALSKDFAVKVLSAHRDHSRSFRDFLFVYPVLSRRSKGISIGVNLNPNKVCNFGCVYCCVDRTTPPRIKSLNIARMEWELGEMLEIWKDGSLFLQEPFLLVPASLSRLNDIAFSGDGEPTTSPHFKNAVESVIRLCKHHGLQQTKLVLITDASCLEKPMVVSGLEIMCQEPHEIWAKLDAGTPDYFKLVNRSSISFEKILKNITQTAQKHPLWIQSLFMQLRGNAPTQMEINAYRDRLLEILNSGGKIMGVQIYTVARPVHSSGVEALPAASLALIAEFIRRVTGLVTECFPGIS